MSAKKNGPSSKLMSMKFMMNAADKEAAKVAEAAQVKVISESHWKLSFKDKARHGAATSAPVTYTPSYTNFIEAESSGRRAYGKRAEEPKEEAKESDPAESDEETPEDAFARRQAEREMDRDTLRNMAGATSLSGAPKRKPGGADTSAKKKHKSR